MTVIFKALKIKKLIEKIVNNDIVKTVIAFVKTNPKLVKVSTMALTGIAVVLVALNATGVTFAFNVTHSGHKLGTVGSPSVFNKARNIAVENVSSENADGAVCSPKLFLTLAVSDKLDDAKKVAEALIQNSEDVFNGSALIINGETVACVNASGLDKLLEARLKSYYISDAENSSVFTADVKVETGYFIKEDMSDVAEVEAIINALEVKTTTSYNTDESIPYSTTRIKTDTQPMGYYKVTTEGKAGLKRKAVVVETVNGNEISRNQLSETVISEPQARVITIGTAYVKVSSENGGKNSSGMICPISSGKFTISAYYGDGRNHKAIDLAANKGVAFYAVASGSVTYAGYDRDFGYNIIIDHGNGIKTRYAHASYLTVSKGQVVSQGDVIGAVGSTGYSTGNHLHFEVIVNGSRVNPAPYIGLR